jgi:2-polyprenyl-3-methyl-5-hydroxy-6-metoxy-1,4-benzoquinol methylase
MTSSCCGPPGCTEFFNEKTARRDARRYRKKGLDKTAEHMVAFLRQRGVRERTVLEIGGGVGALQVELLRAGAGSTTNLELSPAYEHEARELLREAGVEERAERRLANVVEDPAESETADAVLMHRVVCCYPDPEALVGVAADRARSHLVMSFPRERMLARVGMRLVNVVLRLRGCAFRGYVYPVERILAPARSRGFELALEHRGVVWQVAALERRSA